MEDQTLRKWRLILGNHQEDGTGYQLQDLDRKVDAALTVLYESERKGGLGASAPNVNRWLGDIREFFPGTVVKIMQQDAIKRLNLHSLFTWWLL
jgi:hypothetical protein